MPALALVASPAIPARRRRRLLWLGPGALAGGMVAATLGVVVAITGGGLGCLGGGGSGPSPGPAPSRSAVADIPAARLRIYQAAGRRFQVDWTFLASIGAQECNHDGCAGDNGYGCAGPMQIAVRRGSPCSPGGGPTEWERYRTDGDGDGRTDPNDPADAIFTAAKILRFDKGAPATGGSYAAYRQAACSYYGACADAAANYADEVMARAVQYGFRGAGAPAPTDAAQARPSAAASPPPGGCGAAGSVPAAGGPLGAVRKLFSPRRLEPLPVVAVATGGGLISCDARIVPDVVYLTRRYGVRVTACYAIHAPGGEHPLGAAADLVPVDGDWSRTLRLAEDSGWRANCASTGTRPACAREPFRFIGYNGFPDHGDPQHCSPCSGGPHLHISWLTSASPGEPQNVPRSSYFAARWVEAFAVPQAGAAGG